MVPNMGCDETSGFCEERSESEANVFFGCAVILIASLGKHTNPIRTFGRITSLG